MLRQKLISLCLILSALSFSPGCEDADDAFDSDNSDPNKRAGDVCSKTNVSGDCVPYEAEDRTGTSGCKTATNHAGYTGGGFVDFGGNDTWIEWNTIAAPIAGEYTLTFRYGNGSEGNRQVAILVNGQQKGTVPFAKTGSWKTWKTATLKVSLRQGKNTIRVKANTASGGPNLDNMLVVGQDIIADDCPNDPNKTEPGLCGCGVPEGSCGNLKNIALGKKTNQSSTSWSGDSSRAADGNTSGKWGDGSITHTDKEFAPWWQIDLGAAHRIQNVILFNRTDCCSERLSNFHVDLLDENGNVIASEEHPGQAQTKTNIALSGSGAYAVRVQLGGTNYLSLAEVQVFGSPDKGGNSFCDDASEHKNATLSCTNGETITSIDFASYGLPTGSCDGGFEIGACHASSTKSKVEAECLNKQSCTVSASNNTFGDPCSGKLKQLAVVYSCGGGDVDDCPNDPNKTEPGECGCGVSEGTCNPDEFWESEMVYYDNQGNLRYKIDEEGNRVPDFSYVGYKYGADLPKLRVVHTISPVAGDNTNHIQNAINYVAKNFSKDSQGFRGALLLGPGIYSTDDIIYVPHDGVVIRGSGRGGDPGNDTIIRSTRTGTDEAVFRMGNSNAAPSTTWNSSVSGSRVSITDSIVPIGERTFRVSNSSPFRVGDVVVIRQNCNRAWFEAVDNGGTVNDPGWIERGFKREISFTRYVTQINGLTITVDAPLYQRLNKNHGELIMYKHNSNSSQETIYHNIGIENLRIDIVTAGGTDLEHTETAIDIVGVIDGWVKDVDMLHFSEEAIQIRKSLRITAENCDAGPPVAPIEGGRRAGYVASSGAQQILVRDCSIAGARHGFVLNGSTRSSGVVVLRGELIDNIASSEGGHQQWSMGVLFDNCKMTSAAQNGVAFLLGNRGDWGTSHGWSAANSVMWNTSTIAGSSIVVQKPPTSQNYAIGCSGTVNDRWWFPGSWGFTEGTDKGSTLKPSSLYEAQLADRK